MICEQCPCFSSSPFKGITVNTPGPPWGPVQHWILPFLKTQGSQDVLGSHSCCFHPAPPHQVVTSLKFLLPGPQCCLGEPPLEMAEVCILYCPLLTPCKDEGILAGGALGPTLPAPLVTTPHSSPTWLLLCSITGCLAGPQGR